MIRHKFNYKWGFDPEKELEKIKSMPETGLNGEIREDRPNYEEYLLETIRDLLFRLSELENNLQHYGTRELSDGRTSIPSAALLSHHKYIRNR